MTGGYCVWRVLSSLLLVACTAEKPPSSQHASDAALDREKDAGADVARNPRDTARALAMLEPTVAAERGSNGPIALWGVADLWQHGEAVTLRLKIRACKPGAMYEARVHAGTDCSERTLAAETWSAGEGIGAFGCTPNGDLFAHYARRADNEKPWTIGGSDSTNVVGHAFTLVDIAAERPVTCGVIERAPDAPFSSTTDTAGPTLQIRGAIAGVCLFDRQVPEVRPDCPDYGAATTCASTYCELNRCIDSCATLVQCLAQAHGQDICTAAFTCELSDDCTRCQSDVLRCEVDLCLDTLTCAEPASKDGPCSKVQQCCTMNEADSASCLELTKNLAHFGDAECQRLLDNWTRIGRPCPVE